MRAILTRVVAAGLLAAGAVAAAGAAQQPAPSVLTRTQVRDLAAKAATPAEHGQLRDHFATLATRYEADAKRFAAKAPLAANPNRRSGVDYQRHWTQLGQTAAEMAKSARELAAFHDKLATGAPATRPADSAHVDHLEAGVGAPRKLTDAQLQKLAASARTPSEHGSLVEYFNSLAADYTADASAHAAMAAAYRSNPRGQMTSGITHCERLAQQAKTAAGEAKALAEEHQALAR